jgi:hypothetical protein
MDVEMENEFTQMLLKSIITGMNVPYNYIDSTQEIDFARSLTMTNNPFVRAIINDQEEFGNFYSKIIRELYKNEFVKETGGKKKRVSRKTKNAYLNIAIDNLELRFPTPIYLVLGNMNEQIQNAQQTAEFITTTYYPDDPTGQSIDAYQNEVNKANFRKELYKKHLLPSLEWDSFDEIYKKVSQNAIENAITGTINFAPEAKKKNELDMLEEDEF